MEAKAMSPLEIRRKGIQVLSKELGFVGMVRFLHQFDTGSGDYTQERRELLQGQTIEQIVDEIERRREKI